MSRRSILVKPFVAPRALFEIPAAVLRDRIREEKKVIDFDRTFAKRIVKSLGPEWSMLGREALEEITETITALVREEVNPILKDIIVDPKIQSSAQEVRGSTEGISNLISIDEADTFHTAVHRLVRAAFPPVAGEKVEPFVRRRIKNCLVALRSQQKLLVAAYRAQGVKL